MSFGGFGGFGQSSNNNTSSTFGGFGSSNNNNTGSGFGSNNTTNTGFGSTSNNTSGSGLFGNTTGGFGSSGGGFGNTTSAFGSKPAFGSNTTTGSSLFGGTTATAGGTGFGGFGSNNNTTTSSGFGAGNTGSGLFGNRSGTTGFGSTNTPSSNIFGGGSTTGFGTGSTSNTFGGAASTALGQNPNSNNGTGSVPFSEHKEREGTGSTWNHFQTISFINPYQNYSLEELRLADYQQGRRHGTGGQPGAFGASTGFGMGTSTGTDFGGSSGGGLFGSSNANNNSSSLFGNNSNAAPATTGFGSSNAGGGLFGSKPAAAGGLFGAAASSSQPSTSLFGTSNTATTGFGSGNTGFGSNAANNTTSLFGKPASITTGFGTSGSTGFGQTGTGFGTTSASSTGGLFGSTLNSNNASSGTTGFGAFGNQNQTNQQSGSLFGGGSNAFGNTAQKPAFGASTTGTGGGLFGTNNNQSNSQQTTSLFGNASANAGSGGLFGKPAAAANTGGTGLFGSSTTGGLFGNNAAGGLGTTQNASGGSSLFGKPAASGGLFGNNTSTAATGGGLFRNSASNQQGGGGLFGASAAQPNQTPNNASILGGSILGNAQQNTPQNLHQGLYTSLTDPNAFGNSAGLFSGLANVQDIGPLATPLSTSQKQKKSGLNPAYRSSTAASRLFTPSRQGYGFSYSRYGTPGSAMSVSTGSPLAMSGSTLRASIQRSLGKSFSTSNLRRTYEADESILAPGAFSTTGRSANSNIKSLTINRNLRTDLFGSDSRDSSTQGTIENGTASPPQKTSSKHVSFHSEKSTGSTNSETSGATKSIEPASAPKTNGVSTASASGQPEMEQVRGKELAVVRENEVEDPMQSLETPMNNGHPSHEDQTAGEYSTKPSISQLKAMSQDELKSVPDFTVSRKGCGLIKFDEPVDLTGIDLDQLCQGVVLIVTRSITVYPVASTKPPQGQGLNKPATISLLNSWPRARGGKQTVFERSGPRYNRHVERLKRVPNCDFKSYDPERGIWTFRVPHFTTYGLPDEDDETDGEDYSNSFAESMSGGPVKDLDASMEFPASSNGEVFDLYSESDAGSSNADDTFDFKKKKMQISRFVPGAFDESVVEEETLGDEEVEDNKENMVPFLDERSVGSSQDDQSMEDPSSVRSEDELAPVGFDDMAIIVPDRDHTMELDDNAATIDPPASQPFVPKSILKKASVRRLRAQDTPTKVIDLDTDWTKRLQSTVSPKKQDRNALRQQEAQMLQIGKLNGRTQSQTNDIADGPEFRNSIDLMKSLFGKDTNAKKRADKRLASGGGFKWPYAKKPKTFDQGLEQMDDIDREFYGSFKPSWSTNGMLVCAASPDTYSRSPQLLQASTFNGSTKDSLVSEGRDVQFISFESTRSSSTRCLEKLFETTRITLRGGVAAAKTSTHFRFSDFSHAIAANDAQANHEKSAWDLASVLFDSLHVDMPRGLDKETVAYVESRSRKDALTHFWAELVLDSAQQQAQLAKTPEAKAIALLSAHDIVKACATLIDAKDFRLAALTSLIGGDKMAREDMQSQLQTWKDRKVLSEFEEPIRAIYELLAGNVCKVEGEKGAVEDRARPFTISQEFGFNWRQSFGLRLWYSIFESDPIQAAVQKYREDVEQRKIELSAPVPWFVEQRVPPLWADVDQETRTDLLWGLLELYADSEESQRSVDLVEILLPHNHQLSPLDYRLSWQLLQTLNARGVTEFPSEASNGELVPDEKIDRLTCDYAWQLERSREWYWAAFVLLHLRHDGNRRVALQELLARHAGSIGDEESETFADLTQKLRIPESWIWEAKALFMRATKADPVAEVEFLIKARNWIEAHVTFCTAVAPQAIISNDLETIQKLLEGFTDVSLVKDWNMGGQVYLDFVTLKLSTGAATASAPASLRMKQPQKGLPKENTAADVTRRLVASLPQMVTKDRQAEFLTQIAVQEMSGVVAKAIAAAGKQDGKDVSRILQLPLTEDMYLRQSIELSMSFYRALNGSHKG